jgi:hypothetical protein
MANNTPAAAVPATFEAAMRDAGCPDHWTFEDDGTGGYHNAQTEWARIGWEAGRAAGVAEALAAQAAEVEALREATAEIRDRLRGHPIYQELTEDEELAVGGDAAEFSYLVRLADAAIATGNAGENHG